MDHRPVVKDHQHVTPKETETVSPALPFSPFPSFFPFIRFTYSHTTVESDGKTTEIKAEEHRYENGRLESKRFQGEMEGDAMNVFTKIVEQQMTLFMKSFSLFLPFK